MKQKKKIFWVVYWICTAVGLAVVATVLIVLHSFLTAYEKAQPVHKMDEVLELFQNSMTDTLLEYETTSYDNAYKEDIKQNYLTLVEGKELTYTIKYGAQADSNPAYVVYAGNDKLAEVTLKPDEKRAAFNSKIWNIDTITGIVRKQEDITIVAPSNYKIQVNGKDVLDAPISTEEVADKNNYESKITGFPTENTYCIGNLYKTPEVTCLALDGTKVEPVSVENQVYRYELLHNQTFPQEKYADLKDFINRYTKFCMNDAKLEDVKGEFLPGTDTYSRMLVMDEVNIYSGLHTSLEISEPEVTDYVVYNEDAYAVTVEYNYTVRAWGDRVRENPTLLHIYYGRVNGEWKIVKMLINRNDKK